MRYLAVAAAIVLTALPSAAGQIPFSSVVRASLLFEDSPDSSGRYPRLLKVLLRVENLHDSGISWVANGVREVEAELLDLNGNPAAHPDMLLVGISSSAIEYRIPYGSRLDWLISHGGISFGDDPTGKLAIMIGGRGWLIPYDRVSSYALRVRVRGVPWTNGLEYAVTEGREVLFDVPATKITVLK